MITQLLDWIDNLFTPEVWDTIEVDYKYDIKTYYIDPSGEVSVRGTTSIELPFSDTDSAAREFIARCRDGVYLAICDAVRFTSTEQVKNEPGVVYFRIIGGESQGVA